ncbi:hypothetical protein WOLCODRAFT_97572 [Wolfiporia cocos MD-104 SS10]|uniref:RNA 3'-terminal phosphate cyclase n=1 Tax=Wolfiporia cocos (strain MD-104) TaxID=742152 RepID=A0A2H3J8Y2_WOLCO|nr:hypothetical protein WOLCODRAFT_97572 [Wolfiporia cocos MD-104 SS10]
MQGQLIGCIPGSTNVSLHPKRISLFPSYTIPFCSRPVISTTTTLQGLLPCLLFSSNNPSSSLSTGDPVHVQPRGATSAAGIPQIEYIKHVYLPFLERHFALRPDMRVHTLGFIPRGGGDVRASITPRLGPLQPITLTRRGAVTSVAGRAYAAGLPAKFAREMRDSAVATLVAATMNPPMVQIEASREGPDGAVGGGWGIVLWAETQFGCVIGGSSVGLRERVPEDVGKEAAQELLRNLRHGGCSAGNCFHNAHYDQDQMIIFLALAEGRSTVKTGPLTFRTEAAMRIAEKLTSAKFTVKGVPSGQFLIQCDGVGYTGSQQ